MTAISTTPAPGLIDFPPIVAPPTVQGPAAGQVRRRTPRPNGIDHDPDSLDYHDLDPVFARLSALDADDPGRKWLQRRIITACLPLARHIAQRFNGRGESLDDLEQVARIGLLQAINRFDPSRGSNFLSFAVPTMMGEVRRHFRDRSWSVYVPRSAKENYLRVGPAVDDLTGRLGRAPTVNELATELDLTPEAVTDALLAGHAYKPDSIDTHSGDSDEVRPLVAQLTVEDSSFEFIDESLSVKPLIEALPSQEKVILTMRFFENLTQSQIAARLGCSQMHVSRMLAHTLRKLREQASKQPDGSVF